ncbi:hypothetical protein HBNXNv_0641 [Candidatus Nanohalovita haloferacivicina]|nr:hypothetical protein HBNXNv_0641 [Candidatus Nanohalobia archaeon BNXNv]
MEKTANRKMIDPHVDVGFFYDGDTPVVEVSASGLVEGSYVERYVLDGMSIEAFEELGYDVWTHGFEDSFHSVSQIGELLEE